VKESEMRAIADQITQIKSKKIHSMVDAKISLLKLLTPEQRKPYQSFCEKLIRQYQRCQSNKVSQQLPFE